MNHKEATRKTFVIQTRVNHMRSGDPFFPAWVKRDGQDVDEVWMVWLTTRSGLLPERTAVRICFSKDEADQCVSSHPVGAELNDLRWLGAEGARHAYIRSMMDKGKAPGTGDAGDGDSPLAFDVLQESGISEWGGLAPVVLSFLGKLRIGELKNRFGENWEVAAAFEYCWLTLPPSSPAYVAAAYQFHSYITHDDFAAGYLWRDLECLVHGVETAAVKALEMRKSAGTKGGKKAEEARGRRRIELLEALEWVVSRNPDIAKLGPRVACELAVEECQQSNPNLWSQGRGRIAEYIGEIHRGEAGPDNRTRLHALFPTSRLGGFQQL